MCTLVYISLNSQKSIENKNRYEHKSDVYYKHQELLHARRVEEDDDYRRMLGELELGLTERDREFMEVEGRSPTAKTYSTRVDANLLALEDMQRPPMSSDEEIQDGNNQTMPPDSLSVLEQGGGGADPAWFWKNKNADKASSLPPRSPGFKAQKTDMHNLNKAGVSVPQVVGNVSLPRGRKRLWKETGNLVLAGARKTIETVEKGVDSVLNARKTLQKGYAYATRNKESYDEDRQIVFEDRSYDRDKRELSNQYGLGKKQRAVVASMGLEQEGVGTKFKLPTKNGKLPHEMDVEDMDYPGGVPPDAQKAIHHDYYDNQLNKSVTFQEEKARMNRSGRMPTDRHLHKEKFLPTSTFNKASAKEEEKIRVASAAQLRNIERSQGPIYSPSHGNRRVVTNTTPQSSDAGWT